MREPKTRLIPYSRIRSSTLVERIPLIKMPATSIEMKDITQKIIFMVIERNSEKRRIDNPYMSVGHLIGYDKQYDRLLFIV